MPKYLAIVNPKAARVELEWQAIRKKLERIKDYTVEEDYNEICKKNWEELIAIGGDGTLNKSVNRLLAGGLEKKLVNVVPAGLGNTFAKSLGIESINEAFRVIASGKAKEVDIATLNFRDENEVREKFFCSYASIGFDFLVVQGYENIRKKVRKLPIRAKKFIYGIESFINFFNYSPLHLKIESSKILEDKFFILAVNNTKFYAGNIIMAPEAKIDDGLLDICAIAKGLLILDVLNLYKGKHLKSKRVNYFKSKKLRAESEKPFFIEVDGTPLKPVKEASFKLEKKLKFKVPASS